MIAGLVSGQGQLGPALDIALSVDPLDVGADRQGGDEEARGDLLIRQAESQKSEHFEFGLGEGMDLGHDLLFLVDLFGLALLDHFDVVAVPVVLPQEITDLVLNDRSDERPRRRPTLTKLSQGHKDGEMDLGDDVIDARHAA